MWETLAQKIATINDLIGGVVWGAPFLILIVGTGVWLTARSGWFQVRRARHIARRTLLAIFQRGDATRSKDSTSISQFQALSTALAATIGTGNIAGVATAVAIGGPGAVFWMWVSAFFGMMTKFAEATLAIYYRRRNDRGEWSGGAMYYLEAGLRGKQYIGKLGRPLALTFAAFCALAAFGIGNMTQVNSIASAMQASFSVPPLATGIALTVLVALVLAGGLKAVGRVTEKLVPFMALFYIVAAIIIFFMNAHQIPYVFSSIFRGAFETRALAGGAGGWACTRAVTLGIRRGVFSNEAGLGSSAMVHAAADVREPVQQGMWGIFEVFVDTIVVCTLTAFILLSASAYAPPLREALQNITTQPQYVRIGRADAGVQPLIDARDAQVPLGDDFIYTRVMTVQGVAELDVAGNPVPDEYGNPVLKAVEFRQVEGVPLVTYAFAQHFGPVAGKLLAVCVLLFAFSTVLGWSFYGTKAAEYLLGTRVALWYKLLFVGFILIGATMNLRLAWDISDTLNGLMALPNLIGVLALSGTVTELTRNYIKRRIGADTTLEPMLSVYPDIQAAQRKALQSEEG